MLRRDLLASSLSAALLACGRDAPRNAGGARTHVAASINGFAVDLHRALASHGENLVFSPVSIVVALAMVHAGARGATEQALASRLQLGAADFGAAQRGWDRERDGLTLKVANRLFGDAGVEFLPEFRERLVNEFAAPLEAVDLRGAPAAACERINAWVSEQTRGRVTGLVPADAIQEATRLVLASAIYFKAKWAEPFEPRATRKQTFYADGGERRVPMMAREGRVRIGVGVKEKVRILELRYRDDACALLIVLPDARDGLAAAETWLDAPAIQRWINSLAPHQVEIKLPKFRIAPPTLRLVETLRELGLGDVFGGSADLGGMASEPLGLAEVFHRAFIEVDEDGTEAAAATSIAGEERGMPPRLITQPFVVDHPFLYMIRDTRDGSILFMGRVTDPTA